MGFKVLVNGNPLISLDYPRQRAITIGNFDGCHMGHQRLIEATNQAADRLGLESAVLSFSPHPEDYFARMETSENLFSRAQKERAIQELGVQLYVDQRFDGRFASLTREEFLNDYLLGGLSASYLTIGPNFRFGRDRKGSSTWLKEIRDPDVLAVDVCDPEVSAGEKISSTWIRSLLKEDGDVELANQFLGRPYLVEGTIRSGDRIGRTMGFPTLNLGDIAQLIPKPGVYCGYALLPSKRGSRPSVMSLSPDAIPAVFNIGYRPTVADRSPELRVEAHILDRDIGEDLGGRSVGYYFVSRLRDEMKFSNLDALKTQIQKDVVEAKRLLGLT